ncbi:hypothetical protein SDC9_159931 [bioreactor metagenome]|uniref:Uncharacterized protein n=1 Tax=bioreactor metagenome TaxID=1076179 RepID=A0A645FK70_9ZZZZ
MLLIFIYSVSVNIFRQCFFIGFWIVVLKNLPGFIIFFFDRKNDIKNGTFTFRRVNGDFPFVKFHQIVCQR